MIYLPDLYSFRMPVSRIVLRSLLNQFLRYIIASVFVPLVVAPVVDPATRVVIIRTTMVVQVVTSVDLAFEAVCGFLEKAGVAV